ncbi:MAG TPA: tRNA guanosine(34) transglycosylase Tgt [Pirellulaceae bacterium]|nr:tRNA guanosine(34) transglycosylase Tgt [Pirellulaceae bacterium]
MASSLFRFVLHHTEANSSARRGTLHTPHGPVETPAFMPVGTQGTVKGLTIEMVRGTNAQMVLSNTYHLALRPGENVVKELGGLHRFMGWAGPILTDSGGFQLFSLAEHTKITERGAVFKSHIDGSKLELTPERAVQIQEDLGSDVAMVLDHVIKLPSSDEAVRDACQRSIRWAKRCQDAAKRADQAQFAIVQGGLNPELRVYCAEQMVKLDFPGYAIGGLSVGEAPAEMYRILSATCPALPTDKPRYLMGVGRPQDLLQAVRRGVDMFDCVMPTRNGRNGLAFTDRGPLRIRNLVHRTSAEPLDPDTPSLASNYSRGYLRHLFMADEMLGPMLVSAHNLSYYQRLMADARQAIAERRYEAFFQQKMQGWGESTGDETS